jgi:hypothetical protein
MAPVTVELIFAVWVVAGVVLAFVLTRRFAALDKRYPKAPRDARDVRGADHDRKDRPK